MKALVSISNSVDVHLTQWSAVKLKVVEDYHYISANLRTARPWAVSISVIVTCQPRSPFCEGAEFLTCVTVLCHQSGVKKQEDIIVLAQSFCGRWAQRVMTSLNS